MACHTEQGVYIPECWGGLYRKSGCYCRDENNIPRNTTDPYLKAIKKLSREVRRLEARIQKLEPIEKPAEQEGK